MEGNDQKNKNIESKSTNVLTNEKDENGNVDVERKLSLSTALSHNLQHVAHFQGLHKPQTCLIVFDFLCFNATFNNCL